MLSSPQRQLNFHDRKRDMKLTFLKNTGAKMVFFHLLMVRKTQAKTSNSSAYFCRTCFNLAIYDIYNPLHL